MATVDMVFCGNVTIPRLIEGAFVFTLAAVGLVTYLIVIVATIMSKDMRANTYYHLTISLGVSDCIGLLVVLIYTSTEIFCGSAKLDPFGTGATAEQINGMFGGILKIGWFTAIPLILILGFNRYIRLNWGEVVYYKNFDKTATKVWIALAWLLGIGLASPTFLHGCYILFHPETFAWAWETAEKCSYGYAAFEMTLCAVVSVVVMVMYTLIFVKMRIDHHRIQKGEFAIQNIKDAIAHKHHGQEFKLSIQCFAITMWFLLYDIAFITASYVPTSDIVNYFITVAYVINNSINAYVYLAFNKELRKSVRKMFLGNRFRASHISNTPTPRHTHPTLTLQNHDMFHVSPAPTHRAIESHPYTHTYIENKGMDAIHNKH